MLHWPTAVGFHNPALSSINPLISVGLPTPFSILWLGFVRAQQPCELGLGSKKSRLVPLLVAIEEKNLLKMCRLGYGLFQT